MSERIGPIALEKIQQQFLEGITNPRRQVSPHIAEEIDREVKGVIDDAHQIALEILGHNRQLLTEIAQTLLDQETIEGAKLRSHLSLAKKTVEVDQWLQTGKLSPDHLLAPTLSNNGKTLQC